MTLKIFNLIIASNEHDFFNAILELDMKKIYVVLYETVFFSSVFVYFLNISKFRSNSVAQVNEID